MRSGFSTSACAAAAACAAIRGLTSGTEVESVEINLPLRGRFRFDISFFEKKPDQCTCGVIKDAGDDPDVTHGIEIRVTAVWNQVMENRLFGGTGVGIVTLPGLPVEVGQPAINPGPRRLIHQVLADYFKANKISGTFDLTISVPDGERIAQETMNPQLGILHGISILGTDGIVHPYSIPAYRASIGINLNFAIENGYHEVGLVTGTRSEAYLKRDFPNCFVINVGDNIEFPLSRVSRTPLKKVIIGGMIGKMAKLAQGRFNTHVDQGRIDFEFLASLAADQGASPAAVERIRTAVTAHQVQKILLPEGVAIETILAQHAAHQTSIRLKGSKTVQICIYTLDGKLLGSALSEEKE